MDENQKEETGITVDEHIPIHSRTHSACACCHLLGDNRNRPHLIEYSHFNSMKNIQRAQHNQTNDIKVNTFT